MFDTGKGEVVVSVAWIADQGDAEGVVSDEAEDGSAAPDSEG